jgi:hypothetical protein
VWEAWDEGAQQNVALKLIPIPVKSMSMSAQTRANYQREVEYGKKLQHKHICRLFDFFEERGLLIIVVSGEHFISSCPVSIMCIARCLSALSSLRTTRKKRKHHKCVHSSTGTLFNSSVHLSNKNRPSSSAVSTCWISSMSMAAVWLKFLQHGTLHR